MRARHLAAILPSLLLAVAAASAADGLSVDPKDTRFVGRFDLVHRISATPHGYFHVEQYTVTNLGRGLSDFDDCTRGKAVIDIVRLGTSLLIAAREKGWTRDEKSFVDRLLRGHRDGLRGDRLHMATPELATRARESFAGDHARALRTAHEWIDKAPLPADVF